MLDIVNVDGTAAMTVSKMATIRICFIHTVGCNGQKFVMFVTITPYFNSRNMFMYFIFVLDHKDSYYCQFYEENEEKWGKNEMRVNDLKNGLSRTITTCIEGNIEGTNKHFTNAY